MTIRDSEVVVASLAGVDKRFGETIALDHFDFELRRGELVAMLGPNGAGKSTAISILLGLRRADGGVATVLGRPPHEIESRCDTGVMMQEISLPAELRVRELIELVSSYYPEPLEPDVTIRQSGIERIAERRYGSLSGGQKRQTQFALAICGAPKILFLDEPTTHLDQESRANLWSQVRELVSGGTSVVLTTHHIDEAETLADRVVVIAEGRCIASGSVEELRRTAIYQRVECTTAIPLDDIRKWSEVQDASVTAGRLHATTNDAVALLARLISADRSLRDIEVRRATLSEALTLLTSGQATC